MFAGCSTFDANKSDLTTCPWHSMRIGHRRRILARLTRSLRPLAFPTFPWRTKSSTNILTLLPEQEILEFLGVLELLQKGFDILPTRTGVGPQCPRIVGFDVLIFSAHLLDTGAPIVRLISLCRTQPRSR